MTFNFLPKENLQYFLNQIKNKLDLKVDKVSGKTLSTNDLTNSLKTSYDDAANKKHTHANKTVLDNTTASFTTEEKTKLSGIAAGAQANVQSDWDETTISAAAFIKNKPTIPSATSQLKNDSDYTTSEFVANALKSKVDIKEGWDLSENNLTAALITKINNADAKAHTHSNYATLETIEEAYTTAEKNKLKNIAVGAQVNSITGVKGDSETEYRTGNVNITKANVGLGSVDNTTDANKPVSTAQQKAIDAAYANSNKYTDKKIADLINGAPETMDTLKEVSDAINASKNVEEALNKAIGTKANQAELDTHTGNDTIHITATERTNWNDANSKKHSHANKTTLDGITADKVASWDKISNKLNEDGNASNTTVAFKTAATRTNLTTSEKISISFGKIAKWFSDLKTVAFSGSYNDLSNKPTIPSVGNGTVTITQNGTSKGTFTMNQNGDTTIALTDTNTDTWRDVVDNLSSARTDASLSANQGRILGAKLPFALGIDSDGNYGYYKAGADTVTPFKTGSGDEDYGIGEVIFSFRGCQYNYCLLDVTNLNGLLYNQPKGYQGSTNTVFYAYDSWDTAISEGVRPSTGIAFASIAQSIADTKQIWHYLDISNIKYIKIIEGYNWGLTQFSLPYSERTKTIEKIYIHSETYTEAIYKYPTLKKNCLRFTAKTVNGSIIIDPGRYLTTMALGYGAAFGSDTTKYISSVDQPLLIPEIGRDESGNSTSGCYCYFGGNQYGGSNKFDLLIEVIK